MCGEGHARLRSAVYDGARRASRPLHLAPHSRLARSHVACCLSSSRASRAIAAAAHDSEEEFERLLRATLGADGSSLPSSLHLGRRRSVPRRSGAATTRKTQPSALSVRRLSHHSHSPCSCAIVKTRGPSQQGLVTHARARPKHKALGACLGDRTVSKKSREGNYYGAGLTTSLRVGVQHAAVCCLLTDLSAVLGKGGSKD